jgi:hypothetical protein
MRKSFTHSNLCRAFIVYVLMMCGVAKLTAQTSASGQLKFDVPTTLSACATDTVCITVYNNKAVKGITYTGVVKLQVNIPGGVLMKLLPNSLFSTPTGATQTAYAGNVLEVDVPLPAIGQGTKVCFLVQPDCNIGTLLPLPLFTAQATYPAGYPDAIQTVTSAAANVGKGILVLDAHNYPGVWGPNSFFNAPAPIQGQGAGFYEIISITNSGYGDIKEVTHTMVLPAKFSSIEYYWWRPGPTTGTVGSQGAHPVTSTTLLPNGSTEFKIKVFGAAFGSDNVLSPGELVNLGMVLSTNPPIECGQFQIKHKVEYNCGDGQPACEAPLSITSTRTVRDDFPNPVAVLDKYDKIDGCNDPKAYEFTYTNNGTTNGLAYPLVTGVAYDADIYVNFGGMVDISDLTVNGVAINPNDILISLGASLNDVAGYRITFKDRNKNPAYGLVDIDGDGFLDDMPVGTALAVKMKFQTELVKACTGTSYYIYGQLDYRDICRTDKLVYAPPYDTFGFERLTAVTQTTTNDYGLLYLSTAPVNTDSVKTQTVKYEFNYKTYGSLVIDATAASAKLKISQSNRMELNRNSVKLNGVLLTLSSTSGSGADQTTLLASAGDTDSLFIYDIPATMVASLADGTIDNLEYDVTAFNCQIRQNTKSGDVWSLCFKFKECGAAGGGEIDLACKRPFVYSFNRGCGVKPCYVQKTKLYRKSPIGFTAIDELTPIAAIDSMRSYECDTIVLNHETYLNGDWPAGEANGFWTQQGFPMADGVFGFNMNFQTTPAELAAGKSPFRFIENESKIIVWVRDPITGIIDKTVPPIKVVSVQYNDFATVGGRNVPASSQQDGLNGILNNYSLADGTANCGPGNGLPSFCAAYGAIGGYYYYKAGVMGSSHYYNAARDYTMNQQVLLVGKALYDEGFTTPIWNDDNYAIEYKLLWKPRDDFAYDNSKDFIIDYTYQNHYGNYYKYQQYDVAYVGPAPSYDIFDTNSPVSSFFGICGSTSASGLVVSKDLVVENPNRSYVTDCGTTVCNKLYMDSYGGQGTSGEGYFRNGEVRVPYKLNDIKVTLPAGFSLVPNSMSLKVNSGCTTQAAYTNITASATTGLITFTNTAGGDFPRMDDCAGKTTAYEFCYQVQDDNATVVKANAPIYSVFNLTEEVGKPFVLKDTARLSNQVPDLRLISISPVINNTDGGSCQPAAFDFMLYNESDVDANFVHLTVDNSASVTMVSIQDTYTGINGVDSVKAHGNGLFAYIGRFAARDSMRITIKGNTNVCSGDFKVVVDWGCAFPAPASTTAIETASDHEDVANAQYDALAPKMLSRPVTNTILKIEDLCGERDVEFEIRNADLPNLFKLKAGFKLPIGMEYVAGSMTLTHPIPGGTAAAVAAVTLPTADSIVANFIALAPFSTACGLTGSDTATLNNVRVKFKVKFNACPDKLSQEIKLEANAENYCGKIAKTMSILPVIYTGTGGNTNEYSISSKIELKEMCPANGETMAVSDQIFIKNLGGGISPATSSGTDSVTLTIPYNATQMTISNWSIPAPYGPAIAGTNAKGDVTLKILVPAGIAVKDSLAIPITYDLTPKIDKLCLVATNPPLCYFAEFTTQVILKCDASGLNCTSAMPKTIKGSGLSLRQYKCCDVTIGNFVWIDANRDGIQDVAELPISGVKVSLYKNGVKIAETTTATNGEYYFTKKSQSGVTWLGTDRDTAVLPLTDYDIVFGEGQFASGKLTLSGKDYFLTTPNEPTSDLTDNDATVNTIAGGSYPSILALTSPNKGNDFSFDAGFYCCTLALTFTQTDISCNGKNDGTAKANVTGNIEALTYLWSNGAVTQDISGLSQGTYQVTITEGTICSIVGSVTITEPSDITLACAKKDVSVFGATDGEASVVASGGTAGYTYLWSNGAVSATITGLAAGTYTVTVTDANGCTKVCSSILPAVSCTPQNPGTDQALTCVNNTAPTMATLVAASSGFTWYVLTQPSGGAAAINNAGNATNMNVVGDYIFELRNDIDTNCKSTVKITIPSCGTSCPSPNCGGGISLRKL